VVNDARAALKLGKDKTVLDHERIGFQQLDLSVE
jgi:hypothetical protein